MPAPSTPRRPPRTATVLERTQLTPHVVRLVVSGPDLADFEVGEFSDHYVKTRHGGRTRTYTVRDFEAESQRLTLDFVVHGDEGLAGPWAAAAQVGDALSFQGPGGGYSPSPDADWHLMVGDESVVPAIAVSLARIPAGRPVQVIIEVAGPEEEQPLLTPGDLALRWIHRSGGPGEDPDLLLGAVRELMRPAGRGHAFVHGEAEAVLRVRRHLVQEWEMGAEQLSATGYWKLRRTDEQWREEKRDWLVRAEADLGQAGQGTKLLP